MSYGHGDRHDDLTGRLEPNRAGNGSWKPDADDDEFSPGRWSRDRDTRAGGRREGRAARRRDPIRRLLTCLVVVIAVVQVAAMVLLWPRGRSRCR